MEPGGMPVNQRAVAAFLAMPLVAALAVVALLKPLPYTSYAPGPTIDVLGAPDGKEIIQVPDGQKTYRDSGQLRMVTVSVTPKDTNLNLFEVMGAWLDRSDAVYPKKAVYPDDKSADEVRDEGQVEMVSSQDTAVAVAEKALGYDVTPTLEITLVNPGSPSDGALAARDLVRKVNGTPLSDDIGKASDQLRAAIKSTAPGQQVTLTVLRDGKEIDVPVTPEEPTTTLFGSVTLTGSPEIGIFLGQGFILPFPVSVTIDSRIGGPSAGLMFSLAIYDTLTPGSLTGGGAVAGTGEIAADGTVGAIGGIQQKIVGAREDGAKLFLVPADNCADVKGAHNGDMRLARVDTFDTAKSTIEAWAKDHDAKLPSCS
jgi:PDZ domain-containing protein